MEQSQILFLPGGFSGGDEPDGSGKFITAFFRNPGVRDAAMELLKCRDGLMLGICNGFQALIKLGLVPYGEIRDMPRRDSSRWWANASRRQPKPLRWRMTAAPIFPVPTTPTVHWESSRPIFPRSVKF